MGGRREKLEDIVLKLRQVEVLSGEGKASADAVLQLGIREKLFIDDASSKLAGANINSQ